MTLRDFGRIYLYEWKVGLCLGHGVKEDVPRGLGISNVEMNVVL